MLAQIANLKMNIGYHDVMHEDGDHKVDLSKIKDKYDNYNILDWLSGLIDAHVDVAKDPYIVYLNVNEYTYNTIALLLRGGVGEKTFDFIAQPILRELAPRKNII